MKVRHAMLVRHGRSCHLLGRNEVGLLVRHLRVAFVIVGLRGSPCLIRRILKDAEESDDVVELKGADILIVELDDHLLRDTITVWCGLGARPLLKMQK